MKRNIFSELRKNCIWRVAFVLGQYAKVQLTCMLDFAVSQIIMLAVGMHIYTALYLDIWSLCFYILEYILVTYPRFYFCFMNCLSQWWVVLFVAWLAWLCIVACGGPAYFQHYLIDNKDNGYEINLGRDHAIICWCSSQQRSQQTRFFL